VAGVEFGLRINVRARDARLNAVHDLGDSSAIELVTGILATIP
jgi:hypothetical protein